MSVRVTPSVAVVLVALVFSVAFWLPALGSSPAPKAVAERPALAAEPPGARPDLSLTAARSVPALRDPRKPRVHRRPKRQPVTAPAPRLAPVQVAAAPTPAPAPAPAPPRYVPPPAPRYVPPRHAPTPAPQPSGQFDSSGSFDSSGTP